jgi:hypothetical protein
VHEEDLWQIALRLPIGLGILFAAIYLLAVRREPLWPLRLGAFLFLGLVVFNVVVYWVQRSLDFELRTQDICYQKNVPVILLLMRILSVVSQAVHVLAIAATVLLIAAGRKRSQSGDEE